MKKPEYKTGEEFPINDDNLLARWVEAGGKAPNYHITVDPYKADGSGTLVISTDGGFITKDSREVWDVLHPFNTDKKNLSPEIQILVDEDNKNFKLFVDSLIKQVKDKPWITTVVSGTTNDSQANINFIKDSIDTKWLEENNK